MMQARSQPLRRPSQADRRQSGWRRLAVISLTARLVLAAASNFARTEGSLLAAPSRSEPGVRCRRDRLTARRCDLVAVPTCLAAE